MKFMFGKDKLEHALVLSSQQQTSLWVVTFVYYIVLSLTFKCVRYARDREVGTVALPERRERFSSRTEGG